MAQLLPVLFRVFRVFRGEEEPLGGAGSLRAFRSDEFLMGKADSLENTH